MRRPKGFARVSSLDARTVDDRPRIGLVAGWGRYPVLVAQSLQHQGHDVYCLGVKDHATDELRLICHHFQPIGVARLGAALRYFRRHRIVHATMARAGGDTENLSMETAAKLHRAGIPVALQSGYEGYVPKTRVVLFEAAVAVSNGLTMEEALSTVTVNAAKILGIEKRVGTLEAGKDADLALFDGDPFEYTSHVTGVVIDGQVVSEEKR